MAKLLEPLLGRDIKEIMNQIHWKQTGAGSDFAWHQDSRFREPRSAFALATCTRDLRYTHHRRSGCMRFVPRSHDLGDLSLDCSSGVFGRSMSDPALEAVGMSADEVMTAARTRRPGVVEPLLSARLGPELGRTFPTLHIKGYVKRMIVTAGSGHFAVASSCRWARASAGALRGGAGTYGAALCLALCL